MPSPAWWDGWWERLIRLIKELLRHNLGKSSLYYVELYTILCDIDSVINQRPDLLNRYKVALDLDLVDSQNLRGRFRCKESLRKRFRSEYLAELVNVDQRITQSLKFGDVVLVRNDSTRRVEWSLCRIVEVYEEKK